MNLNKARLGELINKDDQPKDGTAGRWEKRE